MRVNEVESGPHYEISSSELAAWVDQQGDDCWWNVDGDPLLTGRMSFPCPGDELAKVLRFLNRPLLVRDLTNDRNSKGQAISAKDLDTLVRYTDSLYGFDASEDLQNRWFHLCWKGRGLDWLLLEDKATAESVKREALTQPEPS